jgi:hypothetical protein
MPNLTRIICEFDSGDVVECQVDPERDNHFDLKSLDSRDEFLWEIRARSTELEGRYPFKLEVKGLVVNFTNHRK